MRGKFAHAIMDMVLLVKGRRTASETERAPRVIPLCFAVYKRATPPALRRSMTRAAREESKGTAAFSCRFTYGLGEEEEQQQRVEVVVANDMSRLGGDQPGLAAHHEEGDDDELFETSSSVSGGESDDDEDQFSDGGAEDGGDQDHRRYAPQPVRRMNSDSLYDMSSVMAQLPVKKGLSRYYEGKSQSFACMSEVRCLEDLRKKENPYKQKIKSCKSYVALGGIANKPLSSCANLSLRAANGFRAPPIPVNKNGYHQ